MVVNLNFAAGDLTRFDFLQAFKVKWAHVVCCVFRCPRALNRHRGAATAAGPVHLLGEIFWCSLPPARLNFPAIRTIKGFGQRRRYLAEVCSLRMYRCGPAFLDPAFVDSLKQGRVIRHVADTAALLTDRFLGGHLAAVKHRNRA